MTVGRRSLPRRAWPALVALAIAAGPAWAKEPDTLVRSSKWVVDYDRDSCNVLAQFGSGMDAVTVRLTRYTGGDAFDLALFGRRFSQYGPRSTVSIAFGPDGQPASFESTNGTAGSLPMVVLGSVYVDNTLGRSTRITPADEARISELTVDLPKRSPVRLQFGPLGAVMKQMRLCVDNLVRFWGYDPAQQAALSRRAVALTSPNSWLKAADYPLTARLAGENGLVQFRIDIDEFGKVTGCHVLARTSPDVFADATCRAVRQRARVQPALDSAGKPVRTFVVQRVRWQMLE